MLALLATVTLVVVGDPPAAPVNDDTRQAYQAAKEQAGRTPDDQVKLAYWCEAHGLSAERMRHLAQAVLANPNHAAARGLLGLVSRQDRWMRPEAVADQVEADANLKAKLADYDQKRSATPYTADGQFGLAQWAEEQGLKEQAKAHYTAVVRLDPKREQAWKRLGYAKHDGHWLTDGDLAAAKADAEAQEVADKKWKPLLERWKSQLKRPSQRADAEANLLSVTDARAVPSVGKVFGRSESDGLLAVRLLGQIDSPSASKALAALAMFSPTAETRRVASETLRSRDPREYASLLIPLIRKPIKYEVQPVNGPGSPGVLFVEGDKANVKRLYEPKMLFRPNDRITVDRFGQPVVERVLSNWAYSKGGKPFNPGALTGAGVSYDDFYSHSNTIAGDLTNSFNISQWGRLSMPADPIGDQLKSLVKSSNSPADLATQMQAFQKQSAAGSRQIRAPWYSPTNLILSNGSVIDPRDAAQRTAEEFPLVQAINESIKSAQVSQKQLDNDVAGIERYNTEVRESSDRVVGILNNATGENLSTERLAWERWWVNLLGYAFVEGQTAQNPTFIEVIPSGYQPEVAPSNITRQGVYVSGMSCFGAGTLVQTQTGPQPIEQLKVGDMVLTQSTATGALGYQPILITHHNPPSATFRIKLADDTIIASHFHRFWVARRGWVMARDLKAGDPVRTLGGVVPVESVEAGKVELVYNLDIADDADFFAGTSAALVHDNTLPDPRLIPFDLAPEVVAKR